MPRIGKKVCVIGAGAAGLAAGRVLRDAGLHVDIFERAPDLGGIWRCEFGSMSFRLM
jgi:cation diffusion facilitator CzcD-associated flavoprotein CzcO